MDPSAVVLIIFAIISVIICGTVLYVLVSNTKKAHKIDKPNRVSINLTYCTIILFMISLIFFICFNFPADFAYLSWAISVMWWNLGQLFMYILLIQRLYYAFRNTRYKLSICIYILFGMLLLSYALCIILFIVWGILLQYFPDKLSEDALIALNDTYVIGEEIIDFILSIYLIAVFVQRLMMVTVDLQDNQSELFINDQIATLNEQQKKILNIMTKYFILSFIATITTQIECMLWCVGLLIKSIQEWAYYLDNALWPIECAANTICLFLIFKINSDWYNKLCKGCHSCIRLWCRNIAKRKIHKKYSYRNADYELKLMNL